MTSKEIIFNISSPPDREFLVADIFIGSEQIAEINRENEDIEIQIYPRKSSEMWDLNFDSFLEVLHKAKENLCNRYE